MPHYPYGRRHVTKGVSMLKIFAALLAVLVMTSQTFALSESEYKRLLSTSAEYRQAEAELSLT